MGARSPILRRCFAALAALAFTGACDRRVEAWREVADEPPPPARPVRIPGLEQPAAQPMAGLTPSAPTPASGAGMSGTLRLSAGARVPEGSVLFVIARAEAGGPPLAVKRLPAGPSPLAFEMDDEPTRLERDNEIAFKLIPSKFPPRNLTCSPGYATVTETFVRD